MAISSTVPWTIISVGFKHPLICSCPSWALSLSPKPKTRPLLVTATVWYSPVLIWDTWWERRLSSARGFMTLSELPRSENPRLPKPIHPKAYTKPSSVRTKVFLFLAHTCPHWEKSETYNKVTAYNLCILLSLEIKNFRDKKESYRNPPKHVATNMLHVAS